ncbi:unnamed protein product [Rangifer tarandus platyrhynchus]|uniref:Uncharacterized protein n=1 Tax=Rangifer tarandus platyrhynchus TaxID=3082113 RepID=A0ACB1KG67_RANTA
MHHKRMFALCFRAHDVILKPCYRSRATALTPACESGRNISAVFHWRATAARQSMSLRAFLYVDNDYVTLAQHLRACALLWVTDECRYLPQELMRSDVFRLTA